MTREAPEKGSTYPQGGWKSRKRLERRPDVRTYVDQLVWGTAPVGSPAPRGTEALLAWLEQTFGAAIKLNKARTGDWWLKAAYKVEGARLYFAVKGGAELNMFALARDLAETGVEILWGLRKASPDIWRG